MKKILSKVFVACLMIIATLTLTTSLTTSSTHATDNNANNTDTSTCNYFLGMVSWDCDLDTWNEEGHIKENIYQIIVNIGEDGITIAGYVALGFIIYGGYTYMMSSGDTGKMMSAKKIIQRAIIGLLIVACAKLIASAIIGALGGPNQEATSSDGMDRLMNAINWIIGVAGIVCVIYIVVGGFGYMTSAGDPGKLQRAKNTILYAIIGLIIVALSFAITNFVISRLANGQQSYLNESSSLAINMSKKG